jgi:hypothetical protein
VARYKRTQIGHVIIWSVLAIIVIADGGLIGSSSHREPPVIVSIILLVCLVLFYKLWITIEDDTLCLSFGIGSIRKIATAENSLSALMILTEWSMQSGAPAARIVDARLGSFAHRCQCV